MTTLGRKQSLTREAWDAAAATIDTIVPPNALDRRIDQTVEAIQQRAKNEHIAYGWSGGKDSIALGHLMRLAGQTEAVLVISDLEYPSFLKWVEENKPQDLTILNTGQDHEWLRSHPKFLFPDTAHAATLFSKVQHTGQRRYYRDNDLSTLCLGRRRADGNYTGGKKNGDEYTDRHGMTRWSPIADWTHEEIIALLTREHLPLPPIYDSPRGFIVGSGPWHGRQGCSPDPDDPTYGWNEVYATEPEVVHTAAAENIPGAADYLSRK